MIMNALNGHKISNQNQRHSKHFKKRKIPSALVFLAIKIKKKIQSMYKKKCCQEKHVD